MQAQNPNHFQAEALQSFFFFLSAPVNLNCYVQGEEPFKLLDTGVFFFTISYFYVQLSFI